MTLLNEFIKRPVYYLILLYGKMIPKTVKWDQKYLKLKYRYLLKEKIDFDNPTTFNEKLQWLKIHDRKDIYTTMVDKYEAKKYVASIIGEEYIIPTLGIYNTFDEIDFSKLPNQFVIKCTHDSGGLIIVRDKEKLDMKEAKKKISRCLKRNYYNSSREWPYKNVVPRIIIEKYIEDMNKKEINDYKFFNFNGKSKIILVCSERSKKLKKTWFDDKFVKLDISEGGHDIDNTISKPQSLELMKKFSEILSTNIAFVRTDFYDINGKIYFGEITFYPSGGFERFEPSKWNKILGDYINLDVINEGEKNE